METNIKVEATLRGRPCDIDLFRILCNQFGLEGKLFNRRPTELSLGMRQRIEIAKALSFHPGLLLLDEALSGIDGNTKREVAQGLWEETDRGKITVVGTAHQIGDLLMLAQRVYFIDGGKINEVIEIEKSVTERLNMEVEALYKLESAKTILKHI